jgi:hypothetical protein
LQEAAVSGRNAAIAGVAARSIEISHGGHRRTDAIVPTKQMTPDYTIIIGFCSSSIISPLRKSIARPRHNIHMVDLDSGDCGTHIQYPDYRTERSSTQQIETAVQSRPTIPVCPISPRQQLLSLGYEIQRTGSRSAIRPGPPILPKPIRARSAMSGHCRKIDMLGVTGKDELVLIAFGRESPGHVFARNTQSCMPSAIGTG